MHVPSVTVAELPDPLPDGISVLDVREPVEWEHGHIEGAVHLPLRELTSRLDEVPTAQASFYEVGIRRNGWVLHHSLPGRADEERAALTAAGLDVEGLERAGRMLVE